MTTRIYNYVKTAAPSSTDDSVAGYSVGDNWLDTTNDKIYRAIDVTNGAAKWLDGAPMYWGATAPGSPIADDLWVETDTNILWTYGTFAAASRWVSSTLYTATFGNQAGVLTSNTIYVSPYSPQYGYDVYIDNLFCHGYVATTNNGSNYWNIDLRKVSGATQPANAAGTLLGAGLDTSAQSADTWFELTESIDAILDRVSTSLEIAFSDNYKSSAPGNAWLITGYSYRLVHP